MTGWNVVIDNVDVVDGSRTVPITASNGVRFIDLNGTPGAGVIETTITDLVGNWTYQITFFTSGSSQGEAVKNFSAMIEGATTAFVGNNTDGGTWDQKQFSFTATGATSDLRFTSGDASSDSGPWIDNLSIVLVMIRSDTFRRNGYSAWVNTNPKPNPS